MAATHGVAKSFKFIYRTGLYNVLNILMGTYIKFLQNAETNWIVKNCVTGVTTTDFKYVQDLFLCDKAWMDF